VRQLVIKVLNIVDARFTPFSQTRPYKPR